MFAVQTSGPSWPGSRSEPGAARWARELARGHGAAGGLLLRQRPRGADFVPASPHPARLQRTWLHRRSGARPGQEPGAARPADGTGSPHTCPPPAQPKGHSVGSCCPSHRFSQPSTVGTGAGGWAAAAPPRDTPTRLLPVHTPAAWQGAAAQHVLWAVRRNQGPAPTPLQLIRSAPCPPPQALRPQLRPPCTGCESGRQPPCPSGWLSSQSPGVERSPGWGLPPAGPSCSGGPQWPQPCSSATGPSPGGTVPQPCPSQKLLLEARTQGGPARLCFEALPVQGLQQRLPEGGWHCLRLSTCL